MRPASLVTIPSVPPPTATSGPATVATPAAVIPSPVLPFVPEPVPTTPGPVAVAEPTPIVPAAHAEPVPVPTPPEPKLTDPPGGVSVPPVIPAPTPPPASDKPEPKSAPRPSPCCPRRRWSRNPSRPPPAPSDLPTPPAPKPVVPTFEPTDRKPDPVPPVPTPTDPPATFRPVTMDPQPKPKSEPTDARPAGGSLNLTKPPGELGVRPAGNAEPPKTDFDVDLHRPKAGDTYEAISKLHYRDARYAEALRQYNRGLGLDRGMDVQVPPMYVLRQRFPQQVGAPRGSPGGPEWTPSAGRERK